MEGSIDVETIVQQAIENLPSGPVNVGIDERTALPGKRQVYSTIKLGSGSRWLLSTGGHYGVEANAGVDPATGRRKAADWYAYSAHLFYTINPQLRLAMRAEWFRDDEGTRTGQLKRPGLAASFYDLTVGLGYKPNASVQIRPEVRWDWTPDARPFNDQTDKAQLTAALDVIWRF